MEGNGLELIWENIQKFTATQKFKTQFNRYSGGVLNP